MPKITLHGGPSHKGDPPRSFGAMLAAARAGEPLSEPVVVEAAEAAADPVAAEVVPAAEPSSSEDTAADVGLVAEPVPAKRAPRVVKGKATAVIGGLEAGNG